MIFCALALCSGLELLGCLTVWFIGDVMGGISFSVSAANSIGIIGGADGPTSVFITAKAGPAWQPLLWSVLLAAGLWGLGKTKRK